MENFPYTIDEIAPIMTVPEVARFLGIGRNCVYTLDLRPAQQLHGL